jgi:hypothetical protein
MLNTSTRHILSLILGVFFFGCDAEQRAPGSGPVGPVLPTSVDASIESDFQLSVDSGFGDTGVLLDAMLDATVDGEVDSATFPEIPFSIETRIGERRTRAGIENRVTCQVLNQVGEPIEAIDAEIEVQPSTGFERTENGLIGRRARDYNITCTAPGLGLRDATPGVWTVLADDVDKVVTSLSREVMDAGDEVDVACLAFDAFGNPVYGTDFDVVIDPPPARVERVDLSLTIESSGTFSVSCSASGVDELDFVPLDVHPDLPAQISIILEPDQAVYRVGQVIGLAALASDRFGNPIPDAPFVFSSEPELPGFGTGRFLAAQEGVHMLRAEVPPPTYNNRELSYERQILINVGGPGILCDSPGFGEVLVHEPGSPLTLYGVAEDLVGVDSVSVDGVNAPLRADGGFASTVIPRWGLNVHNIVAIDATGSDSSTFCAYYVASNYADPNRGLDDALQLWLGQDAVDDGGSASPLRSLGDALRRMINAQGLRNRVHEAISAQNPIVPNECRTRVLGVCLFRLGVDYRDYENNGPNQFSMTLLDNGFNVQVEFREQIVRAKLRGTLGNNIRLRAEYLRLNITFDVSLDGNGRPSVSVRSIQNPQVGDLDADFSGILGFLFELVFEAFEGVVRDIVVDTLKDFLTDNVDRVLTDLFGNIDIGSLGAGFVVPSLSGASDVELNILAELERLDFSSERIEVGLKSIVQGPAVLPDVGLGIPLLPGANDLALSPAGSVAAGVRIGLLNQVLYALWRAGYFELQAGGVAANLGANLPEGSDIQFRFPTCPWVTGTAEGTGLRVYLGPLIAVFSDPVFGSISLQVAAEFAVDVELIGERDIEFTNVGIVDSLNLSFLGGAVTQELRNLIETNLTDILANLIEQSLNDGLPSLPLPEFVIPASLAEFDLPVNTGLGLRTPMLEGREAMWSLGGVFGE